MMMTTLKILGVWLALNAAAPSTDCTAPGKVRLTEAQMNPVNFRAYVEASGLKTVDDVTCCLPQAYLDNFVVIHSSRSAQSSNVDGERVLTFNKLADKPGGFPTKPLQMILSFNGGDPDLNNAQNMEVFFNNRQAGESELYDADFTEKKPHFSGKNPEACVRCHGNQGEVAAGGIKPIFEDTDQWTRAVQGVHGCGNEEKIARAIERRSRRTFRNNPRYRCLNQQIAREHHFTGKATSTAPELLTLDIALNQLNARRAARYLRTTPDYDAFKFAALGMLMCDFRDGQSDSPRNEVRTLRDWLPSGVIRRMTDTSTVASALKTGDPLEAARVLLQRSEVELNKTDAALGKAAIAMNSGDTPDFDFYRGPLSTCNDQHKADTRIEDIRASLKGPPTLDLYKIDAATRGFRGSRFNPLFRYVFEARGVRVDDLAMEPLGQEYPTTPGSLSSAMMELEPADSALGKIRDEWYRTNATFKSSPSAAELKSLEKRDEKRARESLLKGCVKLAELSRAAAGTVKAVPTDKPAATATAH